MPATLETIPTPERISEYDLYKLSLWIKLHFVLVVVSVRPLITCKTNCDVSWMTVIAYIHISRCHKGYYAKALALTTSPDLHSRWPFRGRMLIKHICVRTASMLLLTNIFLPGVFFLFICTFQPFRIKLFLLHFFFLYLWKHRLFPLRLTSDSVIHLLCNVCNISYFFFKLTNDTNYLNLEITYLKFILYKN